MTSRSRKKRRTTASNKFDKKTVIRCAIITGGVAVLLVVCFFIFGNKSSKDDGNSGTEVVTGKTHRVPKIDLDVQLLDVNKFSRPGLALKKVNAVAIHYTANPGTSAMDNRDYFNNLPINNESRANPIYASSHFVIGLEGETVQCIPLAEMSYATNDRNTDTISIECCHPTDSGKFNDKTYDTLIKVATYVCIRFGLDPAKDGMIRHYDVTGKMCPKYYVKHPEKWEKMKQDVSECIEKTKKELESGNAEYDLADESGKIIEDNKKKEEE